MASFAAAQTKRPAFEDLLKAISVEPSEPCEDSAVYPEIEHEIFSRAEQIVTDSLNTEWKPGSTGPSPRILAIEALKRLEILSGEINKA